MVEQQHDPQVGPGSNEPAETLFELKGCQREEVVAEAVDAASRSFGALNGSLAMTSARSARPGTSTPSQKLSVPIRTAEPASRNRRSR